MFVLADELVVSTVHHLSSYADRSKLILALTTIGILEKLLFLPGEVALLCVATCHLLVVQITLVNLNAVFASAVLIYVILDRCIVVDSCNSVLLLVVVLILVCRTKAICCANNAHEQ